jgi:hypothetical protein
VCVCVCVCVLVAFNFRALFRGPTLETGGFARAHVCLASTFPGSLEIIP